MFQRIIFLFSLFIVCSTFAHATKIVGYEPDYAGRIIQFYAYSDPITKNHQDIFSIHIQSDGNFSQNVTIKETTACYADFDVYSGTLVLEPEKEIKIKLPALRPKTFAEEKNPYFKPARFWFQIETDNKNEINSVCNRFELQYNELVDKNFNKLYFRQSKAVLDSVSKTLRANFHEFNNPFVQNLIQFRLKVLESEVLRQNQDKIFAELQASDFTCFNPGFIDILDRIFTNKLVFETNSIGGNDLRNTVNKSDLVHLKEFAKEKYALKKGVDDLVLLKLLHDAYYSGNFSKQAILTMLENDIFKQNSMKEIPAFAASISNKIVYLTPGTKAPEICLPDLSSKVICTSKSDRNIYLMFMDMELQICREHLKYLPTITEKFKDKLEVYIVLINPRSEKINEFLESHKMNSNVLFDTNFRTIYKIKSYPSCFLLGKDQEIILNPAKSPLDGFENQYREYLKRIMFRQNK